MMTLFVYNTPGCPPRKKDKRKKKEEEVYLWLKSPYKVPSVILAKKANSHPCEIWDAFPAQTMASAPPPFSFAGIRISPVVSI